MKVIDIRDDGDLVLIGLDDGGIRELSIDCFNYTPHIGDFVEIFESGDTVVVSKKGVPVQNNPFSNNENIFYSDTYNKKAVNKWVYVLLAFFLGYIGVHKFYAGKIGAGIVYILFAWTCIPAIIAFVECLIALFQDADVNGNILV